MFIILHENYYISFILIKKKKYIFFKNKFLINSNSNITDVWLFKWFICVQINDNIVLFNKDSLSINKLSINYNIKYIEEFNEFIIIYLNNNDIKFYNLNKEKILNVKFLKVNDYINNLKIFNDYIKVIKNNYQIIILNKYFSKWNLFEEKRITNFNEFTSFIMLQTNFSKNIFCFKPNFNIFRFRNIKNDIIHVKLFKNIIILQLAYKYKWVLYNNFKEINFKFIKENDIISSVDNHIKYWKIEINHNRIILLDNKNNLINFKKIYNITNIKEIGNYFLIEENFKFWHIYNKNTLKKIILKNIGINKNNIYNARNLDSFIFLRLDTNIKLILNKYNLNIVKFKNIDENDRILTIKETYNFYKIRINNFEEWYLFDKVNFKQIRIKNNKKIIEIEDFKDYIKVNENFVYYKRSKLNKFFNY